MRGENFLVKPILHFCENEWYFLLEDESPEAEAADDDAVDEALLAGEPAHGHAERRGVGEGGAEPEHEPVGDDGEEDRYPDREGGQVDARGHDGRSRHHGKAHADPVLQMAGTGHEQTLGNTVEVETFVP